MSSIDSSSDNLSCFLFSFESKTLILQILFGMIAKNSLTVLCLLFAVTLQQGVSAEGGAGGSNPFGGQNGAAAGIVVGCLIGALISIQLSSAAVTSVKGTRRSPPIL
jgi:hypothetical protein